MASIQSSEKFTFENNVKLYDHDPGATTAVESPTTRLDMMDYNEFIAQAMVTIVAAGGMTKLEIVAAAAASGGTAYVIKDSGTIAADAIGDVATQSCTAEEIAQIGTDNGVELRYVAARLTSTTATDECTVTIVRCEPRYASAGLTPATDLA